MIGRLYQLKMKSLVADDGSKDLKKYGLDKPQYTVTLGAGSARSALVIGGKAEEGSVYARELTRPMPSVNCDGRHELANGVRSRKML